MTLHGNRTFGGACSLLLVASLIFQSSRAGAQAEARPPAAPGNAPAPAAAPSPSSPAAAAAPAAPSRPAEAAAKGAATVEGRRAVVRLERAGKRLGFGVVLGSDGRILTALSPLGHGNFVRARFADDSVLSVRVVASDRKWDLALLAPEGGWWTEGVKPSTREVAEGAALRRFRGRALEPATVTTTGRRSVLGRDGAVLEDVLVLREGLAAEELGSPLFDDQGQVVAIVVQACALDTSSDCRLSPYGVPVAALKSFLKQAPPRAERPSESVGLVGAAAHTGTTSGVKVIVVEPGSPAAAAGLRAAGARASDTGDLIVAVEDRPVATPDELRDAIDRALFSTGGGQGAAAPAQAGERRVRLLVMGSGKFREVTLSLSPPLAGPEGKPQSD